MKNSKGDLLKKYFLWPVAGAVFMAAAAAVGFFYSAKAGLIWLSGAVIYVLTALLIYLFCRRKIGDKLVAFGAAYAHVQNQLFRKMDVPFAICTSEGDLIWRNNCFGELFKVPEKEVLLSSVFPETEKVELKDGREYQVGKDRRTYRLVLKALDTEAEPELKILVEDNPDLSLLGLYLLDMTELLYYKEKLQEDAPVLALLYIDNFEEVMAGVEEVRKSLLAALLERRINQYISRAKGVVRKLEKDRFLVVLKQAELWKLQDDKFSIMEDVKTVNIGNDIPVTMSIGVGLGADTIIGNYEYAAAAIDIALGRGGDQAVLKNGTEVTYYGGKMKSTERSTRVKARIKAQALRELIEARDFVMVMGHPMSDLDCVGAAVGIYRAARFSQKKTYIVMNDVTDSIGPVIDLLKRSPDFEPDTFIDRRRAQELFTENALLVVVDTNRPSYTECPELLNRNASVVVMDHHRQGKERIENATLSYVETFASSASEMVAEVVQYYDENLKLRPIEADAILAGIVMDTNNFEDNAGVRTFEAAAYLRRSGANVSHVRKLSRESLEDYLLRAETVRRSEIFMGCYVISVCPSEKANRNQTVVAAQAANEFLNIEGVKASFVLTEYAGKIYLSARSIDEVNVQLLMEKFGGGGHMSIAGAQFTDTTPEEVVSRLKALLSGQEKGE